MAKKRRLSKAEKQKEKILNGYLCLANDCYTIAVYLASFVEVDKTQTTIDFNRKTLDQLR